MKIESKLIGVTESNIRPFINGYFKELGYNIGITYNYSDEEDAIAFLFNDESLSLKRKSIKDVYKTLLKLLTNYDDKSKIKLEKDLHNEFIFLLFYIAGAINYVKEQHSKEAEAYKLATTIAELKILLLKENLNGTIFKIQHPGKSSVVINEPSVIERTKDELINSLLSLQRINNFSKKLSILENDNLSEKELLTYIDSIKIDFEDYSEAIKRRGILMLLNFINLSAVRKYSKLKHSEFITGYHIRFLLPIFDLMGWDFIQSNEVNNIKRIRIKLEPFVKELKNQEQKKTDFGT